MSWLRILENYLKMFLVNIVKFLSPFAKKRDKKENRSFLRMEIKQNRDKRILVLLIFENF